MSTKTRKAIFIAVFILLLSLVGFIYVKFYFVFGEGVKAGNLNYLVHKGYVFKTYEGRLIQTGFRSTKDGTSSIQSNEFQFSVVDKNIADSLMHCSGKDVELQYKEYLGILPWRGVSKFVVDDIIMVKE